MPAEIDLTTHVELPRAELPQAEPSVIVIFGATGDLTRRKLGGLRRAAALFAGGLHCARHLSAPR
jgi:hypothetical protein